MAQLVVTAFVSLDGVMEDPGGGTYRHAGWTFSEVPFVEEAYELKGREQEECSALLLGRRSYEEFAPVWPSMDEFERYNSLPRYVVSTTMTETHPDWPATILRSVDDVARVKEEVDGQIQVHGSATLGKSLADAGLVDRYDLLVFPLLLGEGKRLFSESVTDVTKLRLVEHEVYANDIQKLVYDVVR